MSTAIPTTLNHEQRSAAFLQALALEDGLKELASLKARLLAGLERQAEAMQQQHARLMRAATTGANPEAPEQQALPLMETAPAARAQVPAAAKASSGEEEQPPPEPPKGKGRNRSRKATSEKTGTKRTEASARTASAAQASASPVPEMEELVPAPRVPCCECTHSVADHKDGTGRCRGMVKGRACRCERFTALAVELPGAPGWKVRPFKGQLSTGDGGELAYTLLGEGKETLPLWWVPRYGLAFQDGKAVSCVFSWLGMRATTLSYEKDPKWNWVPREVLRALAEHMGATWPEPREEPADSEAPHPEGTPELDDPFTTPATDGKAAPEFHALNVTGLHVVLGKPPAGYHRTYSVRVTGNSPRACEACGTRERPRAFISFGREDRKSKRGEYTGGGGFAMALCLEHCTVEGVERAWSNRARRVERERLARQQTEETQTTSQETTPCECDGCGETFAFSELQTVGEGEGKGFYCAPCKAEVDEQDADTAETSPVASPTAPLDLFGKPWPAVDEARFPGWFVLVCPGFAGQPDSLSSGRLDELFLGFDVRGPEGQEVRHLRWFPAADGGGCVMVGPHTTPEGTSLSVLPGGLYAALVGYLAAHWPLPEETMAAARASRDDAAPKAKRPRARAKAKPQAAPECSASLCGKVHEATGVRCADPAGHSGGWHHGPPEPGGAARLRWKNADYQYAGPTTGNGEVQQVSEPGAWRVELPERNEHSILRLWLVNDATQERKPATWWCGVTSLRRGHHLAGKLEGEALAAHLELETWWNENADAVVLPLAGDCREGRVPGLKVYEPESFGSGPHRYALSNGWMLETWEGEGEEAEPTAHFTRTTERSDVWERFGPFVLTMQGRLTTADAEASEWSAESEAVVSEAEAFISRGFIFELRGEVAS